jgi:response regulator RpfG family c-di-GMP phosphodiesterase
LSRRDGAPLLLIVDDEPRILSALRRALRREPYEILAVETPAEALRTIEAHEVDLVLSDYKMPGTTGLQLLARIAERRPATVRMLITGWTEAIPEQEMHEVGVHAVINKPWDVDALKETLRLAVKEVSSESS